MWLTVADNKRQRSSGGPHLNYDDGDKRAHPWFPYRSHLLLSDFFALACLKEVRGAAHVVSL